MAAVQTRSGQSSAGTVNVAITTTAGNLLGIVTGAFNAATGVPSRTGETNNVARADFSDAATDHLRGDYMMSIGGNSNVVVGSGGITGTTCCVTEFSGRKTTAALGAVVTSNTSAATTVQPGSITPTSGSDLMTGVTDNGAGTAANTIDSAFVVDEVGGAGTVWDGANPRAGSAHKNAVSAAENPTWTTGGTGVTAMAALMMEFLAATAVQDTVRPVSFPERVALPRSAADFWMTAPVQMIGTDLPRAIPSYPDILRRPIRPPDFAWQGSTYQPPPVTPPPVLGVFPERLARPAYPGDFAYQNSTVQPVPAQSPPILGAYPDRVARPPLALGFQQPSPVWLLGTDQPRAIPSYPDSVARPPLLLGYAGSSPVWLIGTDRPPFGQSWPDYLKQLIDLNRQGYLVYVNNTTSQPVILPPTNPPLLPMLGVSGPNG